MPSRAVRRVRLRGDEERLFQTYNETLVRITTKAAGGSRATAEEACQLAWLGLLRCQPDREQVLGWLIVVARHEAWQLTRHSRREIPSDGRASSGETDLAPRLGERIADPVSLELRLEAREALRALACLPERQRRPMTLKLAGYSYKEICALTGRSYTNVNKHLTRARAALGAPPERVHADGLTSVSGR